MKKSLAEIKHQKPAIRLLTSAIKEKRLAHAYLFTGIKGVGKETTANALVFHLFCEKSQEIPCGTCRACKKLEKKVHPDYLIIAPEKKEITIRQIREVVNFLKYSPMEAPYKVILLKEADKLNLEAANALLKSLEEPPEFALFVLITDNFTQLLPTIISRSQVVRFRALPKAWIAEELKKRYWFEEEVAWDLAEISQGSIGIAISIAEKGSVEELNAFVKAGISNEWTKKFKVIERLTSLEREELNNFFYLLSMWMWKSYLAIKYSHRYPRVFPEEKFQKEPAQFYPLVLETQQALDRYANPELALLNLMIKVFN